MEAYNYLGSMGPVEVSVPNLRYRLAVYRDSANLDQAV